MNSPGEVLKVFTLLTLAFLLVSFFGITTFPKNEGRLLAKDYLLNCKDHAYLYRSSEDYTAPPNKTCSKRYKGHFYYLAEIAGEPVKVQEIAALITGGPSNLEEMVKGFRLEVLPAVSFKKSAGQGAWTPTRESLKVIVGLFSKQDPWKTLSNFAAPCHPEKSAKVHWKGEPIEIIAIRIVAPQKHFVNRTKLGPKPGGGNEIKGSGGWMKIMSAPGHADYVKN